MATVLGSEKFLATFLHLQSNACGVWSVEEGAIAARVDRVQTHLALVAEVDVQAALGGRALRGRQRGVRMRVRVEGRARAARRHAALHARRAWPGARSAAALRSTDPLSTRLRTLNFNHTGQTFSRTRIIDKPKMFFASRH